MSLNQDITFEKKDTNVIIVYWTIKDWAKKWQNLFKYSHTVVSEYNVNLNLLLKIVCIEETKFTVYFKSKYLKPAKNFINLNIGVIIKDKIPHLQSYLEAATVDDWQHLFDFTYPRYSLLYDSDLIMTLYFTNMKKDHRKLLSDDFEILLSSNLHSDVELISVDNVHYRAHKAILASRCAVFRGCFEHDTVECEQNSIESPLEGVQLGEVLRYIYSGKCDGVKDAVKLMSAADYYNLDHLKCKCAVLLCKQLTVKNAIELLKLADLYASPTLETEVLQFIKNKELDIIKSEGWIQLDNAKLSKNIFEHYFKAK